jgi:hypothetical protein
VGMEVGGSSVAEETLDRAVELVPVDERVRK